MRKLGLLVGIAVIGSLVLGGIIYWPAIKNRLKSHTKDKTLELSDLRKAEELLRQSKYVDTLKIIYDYQDSINNQTDDGKKWLNLLVEASTNVGNFSQLIVLYEAYPSAFDNNEKASLLVADAYILTKRGKDFEDLRIKWKGRETLPQDWLALDADYFLLEGKKPEAIALLKSRRFEGANDEGRLVRLALLTAADDPKTAWDYLTDAYNKDPKNPDIRIYRAKLLESVGQPALALSEYIAAVQDAPDNLFLRDFLAEYYMRNGQIPQALAIWLETLSKPSLDMIWLKVLFWQKILMPVKFDWSTATPPVGKQKELIDYLLKLPAGTFWDKTAFEKVPNAQNYLSTQQLTFWLRLLEALKEGNEKEAAELLHYDVFLPSSWNIQLENALKRILNYRKNGSLSLDKSGNSSTVSTESKSAIQDHADKKEMSFFEQLNYYASGEKLPVGLHDLLVSNEVFSATFLAAGWLEASLQLHKQDVLPHTFPDWVAYALTEALRNNRGNAEALKFAAKQKPTPALSLLLAELYMSVKNPEAALVVLKKYTAEPTDIGYRAAWLAALIYIDQGQFAKAQDAVNEQPKLAQDLLGKEIIARIALMQSHTEAADKLYGELKDRSPEAKSYLARRAFEQKDWAKAHQLTMELILQFPDNMTLRENLKQIEDEQQKSGTEGIESKKKEAIRLDKLPEPAR